MVFGFAKKERRVPDLSRYDYYYQNQEDNYNKSHRLSAAAASAATGGGMTRSQSMIYNPTHTYHTKQPTQQQSHHAKKNIEPSRTRTPSSYKTYSLRSQSSLDNLRQSSGNPTRTRSRITSNPVIINKPKTNNNTARRSVSVTTTPARRNTSRATNTIPTPKKFVPKTKKTNTTTNNNNNIHTTQKRTTSLTSNHKTAATVSTATTNGTVRTRNSVAINTTPIKKTRSLTKNNLHAYNNNITTPKKSPQINNNNNSRLNSLTSNGTNTRRMKKTNSMTNSITPQVGGQSSRTNSITTKVTRVTDPQGRTTSITKKTIRRIDGYEYVETTTTTTNLIPLEENANNQRHFDEFSDNFNMMTEDEEAGLNNDDLDEENRSSLLLLHNNGDVTDNDVNYQDELYDDDDEYIDNHIDETLGNGHLQEMDERLSIPDEILEEDIDINMDHETPSQQHSELDQDGNDIHEEYSEYEPEAEPEKYGLLDDVVEEEEEEEEEEPKVQEPDSVEQIDESGNEEPEVSLKQEESDNEDNENTLDMIDRIEMRDENSKPATLEESDIEEEEEEEQNTHAIQDMKQMNHPYSSNLVPLDQASSVSKFSDAVEFFPTSKENLVQTNILKVKKPAQKTGLVETSHVKQMSSQEPVEKEASDNHYMSQQEPMITQNTQSHQVPQQVSLKKSKLPKSVSTPVIKQTSKKKVTIDHQTFEREYRQTPVKKTTRQPVRQKQTPIKAEPKKPLTEQEMYLKALEVAKKKVYSNSYDPRLDPANMTHGDTRSTMGSRMTLRDSSIPKESLISNTNTSNNEQHHHHMGINIMSHDSSPAKHHSKMFGSSLFSKHKHESAQPVVVPAQLPQTQVLTQQQQQQQQQQYQHQPTITSQPRQIQQPQQLLQQPASIRSFEQHSINSSHSNQPSLPLMKPRESKEISTISSIRSEQETKLADEHMYAKALEIAQRRFNDAHQKTLQKQEQEHLNAAKEHEEAMRNRLENSIHQYNTSSSLSVEKPRKVSDNISNNQQSIATTQNSNNNSQQSSHLETAISNHTLDPSKQSSVAESGKQNEYSGKQATINHNNGAVEHNKIIQSDFKDMSINSNENHNTEAALQTSQPMTSVNNIAEEQQHFQSSQGNINELGNELTAAPEYPYETENIKKMPTIESLTHSNHKHRFSRRPSVDVEKGKSKFRNMFDKVVQFSNENSGYQPSKKEKVKLEEQKRLNEQIVMENEQNMYQQQIHPPPLARVPSSSHGAATTLPVEQSLNHFPNGLAPTGSISSFQRQKSENKHSAPNDNVTNSSSIFSHSKKQTTGSITPTDEAYNQQQQQQQQQQQDYHQMNHSQINNADVTANTIESRHIIEKVTTQSSKKKNKPKFFSKLFKRSK